VDTEPDTGASIVGPVLLGAGLIGGISGTATFLLRKKKRK
jgi:LPXTG-motif cell wall-anchored protein